MSLSDESRDAFLRAASLLARGTQAAERERIFNTAQQYIQQGSWIPAITVEQFQLLFYPADADRQARLGEAIRVAQEAGDLKKPGAGEPQGLLASHWADWPGLPPVPPDSPLTHWLPKWPPRDKLACTVDPSPAVPNSAKEKADPERRLDALRALGGQAAWKQGAWKFTGIAKLVRQEQGRPRRSEKTIRADLREAAQAESDAKRNGGAQPTGQNWLPRS